MWKKEKSIRSVNRKTAAVSPAAVFLYRADDFGRPPLIFFVKNVKDYRTKEYSFGFALIRRFMGVLYLLMINDEEGFSY